MAKQDYVYLGQTAQDPTDTSEWNEQLAERPKRAFRSIRGVVDAFYGEIKDYYDMITEEWDEEDLGPKPDLPTPEGIVAELIQDETPNTTEYEFSLDDGNFCLFVYKVEVV